MPIQSTKVAIVTGAARGIGRAIALRAGHGHDVVIVDLLEPELTETAKMVEVAGVKALPYIFDVSYF
jgi:3-oxoacyl-[acyl-carrier protein] reductase